MLRFLWANRERPGVLSSPWFRAWAKRLLLLPSLFGWSWRLARLRARGVRIGQGSMVARAKISGPSRVKIGENSFIGRVHVQAVAPVEIGSNVCINDGVRLITASHDVRDAAWTPFARPIRIEDYAWIATAATLLPGVTIGRGAVVGAGAVVASDVPDLAVAVGNPAQVRQDVRPSDLKYNPVRFLALYTAWLGAPGRSRPSSVVAPAENRTL